MRLLSISRIWPERWIVAELAVVNTSPVVYLARAGFLQLLQVAPSEL
jgi:hypothetical protein